MSNEYAIRVKNVRKSYKLYFDKGSTIKERVLQKRREGFLQEQSPQ